MDDKDRLKWNLLRDVYPEVAEVVLIYTGISERHPGPNLTREEKILREFIDSGFEEGGEEEMFHKFLENRDKDPVLQSRECFSDSLETLVSYGHIGRIPTKDDGFHYGPLRVCLNYLEDKGASDSIDIDQLYWLNDETGVPVEALTKEILDSMRCDLALDIPTKPRKY